MVGLLPSDQLNIANYGLTAYKRSSEASDFTIAWNFSRVAGGRRVTIKFIGVWDTVASVLVPRPDRIIPTLLTLPYTRTNPSVEALRHAMAIDERRRMFRLNRWVDPQPFVANPFDLAAPRVNQDIKQVWFAGSHSDVGGGYPETESGLSKYPLAWMIDEAVTHGLKINAGMQNNLVFGQPRAGGKNVYVAPNVCADVHASLTPAWRAVEYFPKSMKWNEWPRPNLLGWYIPNGEPRPMGDDTVKPRVHRSVIERKEAMANYNPTNLPSDFDVEV